MFCEIGRKIKQAEVHLISNELNCKGKKTLQIPVAVANATVFRYSFNAIIIIIITTEF